MSDDRLLHELGHLARAEEESGRERFDERWDRLAAGTLTPEEEADLRALAATSPEAREALEAFQPLGAEFQAQMVATLAAELRPAPKTETLLDRFFSFFSVPAGRWATAGAAAAAILAFFLPRMVFGPSLLATYAIVELGGGSLASRGAAEPFAEPRSFPPGSMVKFVVRPEYPVTGEVDARCYLAHDAELVSWNPTITIKKGSVQVHGELDPKIQPGAWKVWAVVGRPGKLPDIAELQDNLREEKIRHDLWQAVSADLHVAPRPPP